MEGRESGNRWRILWTVAFIVVAGSLTGMPAFHGFYHDEPYVRPGTNHPPVDTFHSDAKQPIAGPANLLPILAGDAAVPWSYEDGSGFANDIVRAVSRADSVPAVLKTLPYARCKDMVITGAAAACLSMSPSAGLVGRVKFPEYRLFVCPSDAFIRKDRPFPGWDRGKFLRKIRQGTVIGYESPPLLREWINRGWVVTDESVSEVLNLKKLDQGRIDAVLLDYNDIKGIRYLRKDAMMGHELVRAFSCGDLNTYVGFSLRHPAGSDVCALFDRGCLKIAENRTLAGIRNFWTDRFRDVAA